MQPYVSLVAGIALFASDSLANADAIDASIAKKYFAEAKVLSDADGGMLWGIPLYGPMIFADPHTRQAVGNQPDAEGRLAEREGVFVGKLPDAVNISNTAIHWAGVKWTMVVWPLPKNEVSRAELMIHELWHRVQDDLGIAMSNPSSAHMATADGRIWMQLEWRALRKALGASGSDERSAIEDALAFRGYRRSLFPDKVGEENALEMNEGLAEYTGVVLASGAAVDRRARAAEALKQAEQKESFTRSFAYASGPAYGLLLDQHAPRWRESIKTGGDIGAALQAATRLGSPIIERELVLARAKKYEGGELIAAEAKREAEATMKLALLRQRFLDGPTLRLPLGKSNISFDPNRNYPLPEGTVYLAARLADAWGELDAAGGVLISADWTWASVPLKNASEFSTSGEGWSLQLRDEWAAKPRDGGWTLSKR